MRQFGDRSRANLTDVARLIGHGVQHRLAAVESRSVAADPDRQFAAGRTGRPPADRRIEERNANFRESRMEAAHHIGAVCRKVKPCSTATKPLSQSILAKPNALDISGRRQ